MAEILLLSIPVFGHVKPMLAIARELVPARLQADRDRLSGLAKLRFDLATFFIEPCEGFCRDLLRLHREAPADMLVCDSFLMAGA